MPIIKPISDLRNNFNTISEICHEGAEPVYITKNGKGDMVVMSMALYEEQQAKLELYQKLLEAESQSARNVDKKSHTTIMDELREKIDGKKL